MNFIQLPSLKLTTRRQQDQEHPEPLRLPDEKGATGFILPPAWKYDGPPPAPITITPTLPDLAAPIFSFQSSGLPLRQSYAQELFSSPTSLVENKRRRRPPHSYASMIAQAILTSKEQKMTLREIYMWVQVNYPSFYESNKTGWQNTIRHNLSLNRCFYKLPKSKGKGRGKGGYWAVDVQELNNTTFGRHLLDTGALGGWENMVSLPPCSFLSSSSQSTTSSTNSADGESASLPSPSLPLQPANLITLQHHHQRLHQHRRSVPVPSPLVIPPPEPSSFKYPLSPVTSSPPTLPMLHPPTLHHILN
ncbi:hypothetical protein DM01DRAFT_1378681 [Hesseltinella vesiculosa]|uniref:Fork-head domain-containing protein n=1 Tax=Hesseltinella vesiculosa TaxID=101127 RepID=A0A1X2G3C1_9FUNG|nr:hypothetical protein DM01DRAFT_1378681 [Hesseltinella vesiculosa]